MTKDNQFLDALRAGRSVVGLWSVIPDAFAAELLALAGPDYVCVDQQHGLADFSSAHAMFQAISARGSVPITRVNWNEPGPIMRALDAGALGVIVPMVESRLDTEKAVNACRYPPKGCRSYGPVRARYELRSTDPAALEQVACIVMIETRAGLENAEEIVSTPGLDAVYIGPMDLSLALGVPLSDVRESAEHARALDRLRGICERQGLPIGIHCYDGASALAYLDEGFQMVTAGADSGMLSSAASHHLAAARAETLEDRAEPGY